LGLEFINEAQLFNDINFEEERQKLTAIENFLKKAI
jgi:hypothetical protein